MRQKHKIRFELAEIIEMPKLSDTMTEGVVAAWHKGVGDKVSNGELLAEIETDKATMELESFYDGILLYRGVDENGAIPVGALLAIDGTAGEDISGIIEKFKELSAFWREYKNPFEPFLKKGYDSYLKANGQRLGIKSYDAMVALVIAHSQVSTYDLDKFY